MEFNTRRSIVLIGLVVMIISVLAIYLSLGKMQEPLSIKMIFGNIYEAIFGRQL